MAFDSNFAPLVRYLLQPSAGSEGFVGYLEISRIKSNGKTGAVAEAGQFAWCLSSSRLRPLLAHHTPLAIPVRLIQLATGYTYI